MVATEVHHAAGHLLRRRVQPVQVVEAALRDRDERVGQGVGAAVRRVTQESPAAAELLGPQLVAQVEDHDAQRCGRPADRRRGCGREHRVHAEGPSQPGQRQRLGQGPAEDVRPAHRQLVTHTVARGQGGPHPECDVHLVVGEQVAPLAEQVVDVGPDAAVLRTHGIDQELHPAAFWTKTMSVGRSRFGVSRSTPDATRHIAVERPKYVGSLACP